MVSFDYFSIHLARHLYDRIDSLRFPCDLERTVKENSDEPRIRAVSTYARRGRGEDANLEIISPTSTNTSTTIEQSNVYRGFHCSAHATDVSCFLEFLFGFSSSSSSSYSSCSRWLDTLPTLHKQNKNEEEFASIFYNCEYIEQ